jgi:DNA invertase Pin-like site-specific DNA recombinase
LLARPVELVRRYSNRPDLQERLAEVCRRAREDHDDEDPDMGVRGKTARVWRVRDRLTDDDVQVLAAEFLAGTSKRALAGHYGLSLSTVKNILRKHGVRRQLGLKLWLRLMSPGSETEPGLPHSM